MCNVDNFFGIKQKETIEVIAQNNLNNSLLLSDRYKYYKNLFSDKHITNIIVDLISERYLASIPFKKPCFFKTVNINGSAINKYSCNLLSNPPPTTY